MVPGAVTLKRAQEGSGGEQADESSHGRRRPRLVTPSDSPPIRTACCHLPRAARASQAGAEAPGSRGRRYNLGWQDAQATPWARKEHLETGQCPVLPTPRGDGAGEPGRAQEGVLGRC